MKTTLTALAALTLALSPLAVLAEEGGASATTTDDTPAATSTWLKERLEERKEKRQEAEAERAVKLEERKNNRLAEAKERAEREIERRIERLEELSERLAKMVRLSDADRVGLQATIDAQITALEALSLQIESTTATTSLRAYIESITKTYRIYALIMPQIQIIAAADRVLGAATQLEQLVGKLDERVAMAESAGGDVAALKTSINNMRTKIASARAKAEEAKAAVKALAPDNGDQAVQQLNLAALKDARTKIRSAQQELKDARKDAGVVRRGLRDLSRSLNNSTATTSDENGDSE